MIIVTKIDEVRAKLARVRHFMHECGYDAAIFLQEPNFSWLTGGGSDAVEHTNEAGKAFGNILITREGAYLLANNIEMPRILAEEVTPRIFEPVRYGWIDQKAESVVRSIVGGGALASDTPMAGAVDERSRLSLLRTPLLSAELSRFRDLCRLTAEAMRDAVEKIVPGLSEIEIAAITGYELLRRGAFPALVLVGTDQRVFSFRHPVPTEKKLKAYCMLVVCAQKWGLVSSMTRLIHFGPLPSEVADKHRAVQQIDTEIAGATRAGASLAEVFAAARNAYISAGYPGEEIRHFQGGTCGYYSREQDLTPDSTYIIHETEVFAHNPSITGVKSEDTILLDAGTYSVLTEMPEWPADEVSRGNLTLRRPGILVL